MSKKYSAEKLFNRTVRSTPRLSDQQEKELGRKINRAKYEIVRLGFKALDLVVDYSCFADGCGNESEHLTESQAAVLGYLEGIIENNLYNGNEKAINELLQTEPRFPSVAPELKKAWQEYRRLSSRLVNANLYMVKSKARYFERHGFEFLELVQDGSMGLVRAVELYDPSRNNKFRTYAQWWILQSLRRGLENTRTIRLPAHAYTSLKVLRRNIDSIVGEGLEPSVELLVERTGFEQSQVEFMLLDPDILSLDYEINGNGELNMHQAIADSRAINPEQEARDAQLGEIIRRTMSTLSPREHKILRMRFGIDEPKDYILQEVGKDFNLSRERIRQIEAKALQKLRKPKYLRVLRDFL